MLDTLKQQLDVKVLTDEDDQHTTARLSQTVRLQFTSMSVQTHTVETMEA